MGLLHRPNFESIRKLMAAKANAGVRLRVVEWRVAGLIDGELADKLLKTVPVQDSKPLQPKPAVAVAPAAPTPRPEEEEEESEPDVPGDGAEHAANVGQQLFSAGSPGLDAAVGGIAVLAALDEPRPAPKPSYFQTEVWPVLYENIGWFIGALFVLAGSVYGVREAWQALDDGARHALVAGALFGYHAAFVGIAALLAKRAAGAGRVLGGIATGLLPMVFAALGGLWTQSIGAGLALTALLAGLSFLTLRSVGRRFEFGANELASVVLPSLLAQVSLIADSAVGGAFCFLGVGSVAWALRRPDGNRREALAAFALYGALAVEITSALSPGHSLSPGSPGWAALTLRVVILGAAGALAFSREAWRSRWPEFAPSLEVASLGLAATASLVATGSSAATGAPGIIAVHCLAVAGTSWLFFVASRRHPRALHLAVLAGAAASALLGEALTSQLPWAAAHVAFFGAVALQVARWKESRQREVVLRWSVVLALVGLIAAGVSGSSSTPLAVAGALVALGAFRAGGFELRWLHYLGSLGVLVTAAALLRPDDQEAVFKLALAMAALFALAGLAFDTLAVRRKSNVAPEALRPLDDVSLLLLALAVPVSFGFRSGPIGPTIVGLAFLLRAWREQSRGVSAIGATLLAWSGYSLLGPSPQAAALVALACLAVASLRGMGEVPKGSQGRNVFGARLPFGAPLRVRWTDGFAVASFLAGCAVVFPAVAWLSQRDEATRMLEVRSLALVAVATLGAFLTPAFHSIRARGHVLTLGLVGIWISLAGVLNRVGRPLPPQVTAEHLTLIAVGVWGLALALRRWGRPLGQWLGNERSGRLYHFVPHVGVVVLAGVLTIDATALSLSGATAVLTRPPPLLLFGAALALALIARSSRTAAAYLLVLPLALLGSAQLGAHVMGSTSTAELTAHAQLGLAVGAAVMALLSCLLVRAAASIGVTVTRLLLDSKLEQERRNLVEVMGSWSLKGAGAIILFALLQPEALPAGLGIAAGLLLLAANRKSGGALAVLSTATLLHAIAQQQSAVPLWTGPAIAALGVMLVAGLPRLEQRLKWEGGTRAEAHLLMYVLFALSLCYSLAAGGATNPLASGPTVLADASSKVLSQWYSSEALVPSLLLMAIAYVALASQYRKLELKGALSQARAGTVLLASLAVLLGLPEFVAFLQHTLPNPIPSMGPLQFVVDLGWELAPAAAVLAIVAHQQNRRMLRADDAPSAKGIRIGRDVLLVSVALFVSSSVAYPAIAGSPRQGMAVALSFLALVGVALMSGHAAWRERTSFHVYAVQLTVVGIYGLVRTQFVRNLPPEADACFALALGFILLGVTVLSRRAGIPPIAAATRRFAALLPFAIGIIMPFNASTSAALLAAGAGALWSALGWVERSRLFGSLGAAAVNIALLTAALSAGINGPEVYVAPFGLMTLALGQIFAGSLEAGSRQFVRIIGSLLVYLPAAAQLSLQVGSAADGSYAVGFGLACLVGVAAGMVFRIRAYLALGTGFLVLDVVSNLVHASLRDHRIGFAVLSGAGIAILGVMVFITLQRDLVQRMVQSWRERMLGWE